MTYINSNLTNREAYAQHGKLDDERMQELLDLEDAFYPLEEKLDDAEQGYYGAKEQLVHVFKSLDSAFPCNSCRPHVIDMLIEELKENY